MEHLKRRIAEKVTKDKQFEEGIPFIIAIHAQEWRYQYETDYDDFVPIRNKIQEFLTQFPQVSGIILFTNNPYQGKYIGNKNSYKEVRIIGEDLYNSNLLYRPYEPLLTHDKEIEFSKLLYDDKIKKLRDCCNIEGKLQFDRDNLFRPYAYAREDIIEILENINDFLKEDVKDDSIIKELDPIIKKYCNIENNSENVSEQNDKITENNICPTGIRPFRAYAASCQIRLTKYTKKPEDLQLCLRLSEDKNSYVRDYVCKELEFLYDVYSNVAIEITKKYCYDDVYTRWFLRFFISYLYLKNKNKALELIEIIIAEYGKRRFDDDKTNEDIQRSKLNEGETILLKHVVSLVAHTAVVYDTDKYKEYNKVFEDLLNDKEYHIDVKKEIIKTMRY